MRRALATLGVLGCLLLLGSYGGDRYPGQQHRVYIASFSAIVSATDDVCLRANPMPIGGGTIACAVPGVEVMTVNTIPLGPNDIPVITGHTCVISGNVSDGGQLTLTLTPEFVFSDTAGGLGTGFDTVSVATAAAAAFGTEDDLGSWVVADGLHIASPYTGPQAVQVRVAFTTSSEGNHAGVQCRVTIAY